MTNRTRPKFTPVAHHSANNIGRPEFAGGNARVHVAQVAARLIAEGLTDYRAAKQKAARQLGIADHHAIPDNHEVEAALREHLALFARDTQPQALSALREIALQVMMRLQQFSPWLVGPVLNGTATECSEIELEIISVDPKIFEMYLIGARIAFEHRDVQNRQQGMSAGKKHNAKRASYRMEFDRVPVVISLYDSHADRQAANPRDSIRHHRAQQVDAEKHFVESGKPSAGGLFGLK